MSPIEWAHRDLPALAEMPAEKISIGTRVIGLVLRTVFIASMLLVTVRVGLPRAKPFGRPTRRRGPRRLVGRPNGFALRQTDTHCYQKHRCDKYCSAAPSR